MKYTWKQVAERRSGLLRGMSGWYHIHENRDEPEVLFLSREAELREYCGDRAIVVTYFKNKCGFFQNYPQIHRDVVDGRIVAYWCDGQVCEICGISDGSVVEHAAHLYHCCDLCYKKWVHAAVAPTLEFDAWKLAERARLSDHAYWRQHEEQRRQIRTCGTAQANTSGTGTVVEISVPCARDRTEGVLGVYVQGKITEEDVGRQACKHPIGSVGKVVIETPPCDACGRQSVTHIEERMNGVVVETEDYCEECARKAELIGKAVPEFPIKERIYAALKETRRAKDVLGDAISSAEYVKSCLKVSSRKLEEKNKVLPTLRRNYADASYAAQRREEELVRVLQEIRKAIQRTLPEWPKCDLCGEAWAVGSVSVDAGKIGLQHECHSDLLKAVKEGGPKVCVSEKEIKYSFSPAVKLKIKEFGLG